MLALFVLNDLVDDGCEGHGGVGVGPESIGER